MGEINTKIPVWRTTKMSNRKEAKDKIIINRKVKASNCYYDDCESTA